MTYLDEALARLGLADETLDHARINYREGLYRVAVSLAYYAAFYAARSVLAYHREGPKTHQGTRQVFGRVAVKGSDFPAEASGILTDLAENRGKADYDFELMDTWGEAEASSAIERAGLFIDEVHAWYGRHHQPQPSEPSGQ